MESLADLPVPKDDTSKYEDTNRAISSDTAAADEQMNEVKSAKRCDRCKEETTAVCYCVECDKSLCPRHEQVG